MHQNVKEQIVDVLKDFFSWVVVTAVAFVWWLAVLLIISLFLLNVWKTSFDAILHYTVILAAVTSVVYLICIIRRRFRTKEI